MDKETVEIRYFVMRLDGGQLTVAHKDGSLSHIPFAVPDGTFDLERLKTQIGNGLSALRQARRFYANLQPLLYTEIEVEVP